MTMYKACSRCGRIHKANEKCYKGYSQYNDTEEYKMRNTNAWHKKSRQVKQDAQYQCEVCKDKGIIKIYPRLEVHHIEKVSQHPELLLDDDNLICLCVEHHKQADSGKLDKAYLKKIVQHRGDE